MAGGIKTLNIVQYGLEATHGTAVPADTILALRAAIPNRDREVRLPDLEYGARSGRLLSAAHVPRVFAEGTLEDMDGAYFEALPLIFSAGLKGNITPTEKTASEGDWEWAFPAPMTGAETVDSFTLEAGDNVQGYEIAYTLLRSIKITGDCETGECHVSADFFGDLLTPSTLTPSLTIPTITMMNGKLAQLFVDDTWAAVGTNELAGALCSFEITINTGVHPKWHGSATRKFDGHDQGPISVEAVFHLERTAGVITEMAKYRPASGYAVTPRFVGLVVTGPQIGAGENAALTLHVAGIWDEWAQLGTERNGNNIDVVKLVGGYDVIGEQMLNAEVIANVPSI